MHPPIPGLTQVSLPMAQFSSCQPGGGCVPSPSRLNTTPLVGDTGLEGRRGRREEVAMSQVWVFFIHSSEESWPFQGYSSQNKCINRHFFFCFTSTVSGGAAVSLTMVPKFFSMEPDKDLTQNRGGIVRLKPPKNKNHSDQIF